MLDAGGDMLDAGSDRPSTIPWPPVLLTGALLLALSFDYWIVPLPVPFAETLVARLAGFVLLAAGLGMIGWALHGFQRHATTVRPDRAASHLITSGAFAYSRNPIYLGEAAALLAAALICNRLSLAFIVPPFVLALTRLAIRREEAHLERRFGAQFAAYCDRVGRWF